MDTEAFIHWALDDSRTVEERYTVELLVEEGVRQWNWKRKNFRHDPIDAQLARERERKLNPAYDPHYSEISLRKAAECLAGQKAWSPRSDRPVRDLAALRFMQALEEVSISFCFGGADISPLASLPALRKLAIGYPGADCYNHECRDYTPLARCAALRELTLGFGGRWPDFTGIGELTQLETLTLSGNLLALPRGVSFPKVRTAVLRCMPLASRDVADLLQLPACESLTLSGAERLDGIAKMPALRNLTLIGPFHSFEPLTTLRELTCLIVTTDSHLDPPKMPRDVAPLARLPKLHFLKIGPPHGAFPDLPRDYSPLTEAPALRELIVQHCPPVEMEVAAIQAGLQGCEDLYLLPEPQPPPMLRMVVAPPGRHPQRPEPRLDPGETRLIDPGLRECEGRWISNYLQNLINERLGHSDWGEARAIGPSRSLYIEVHSFECVAKFPIIIEATREAMARLRPDYRHAGFAIHLSVPPPEDSPAQKELLEKFRDEEDRWQCEERRRDHQEYIDRLHRMELKKQEGTPINPEEFSPGEREAYPEPPWEKESDEEDDEDQDDEDDGQTATKQKPAPPSAWLDDAHPLADNYRLFGTLIFDEVWFPAKCAPLAIQLMGREPDEVISPDPNPDEV